MEAFGWNRKKAGVINLFIIIIMSIPCILGFNVLKMCIRDRKSADRLCRAASLIGFAFQIRDDILDVTSSLQELGKPVFSDEKNNKTTYVTLYGMEKAEADVQAMSDEALDIITVSDTHLDVYKRQNDSCCRVY